MSLPAGWVTPSGTSPSVARRSTARQPHLGLRRALDWDYRELGAFCGRACAGGNAQDKCATALIPPHLHVYVNQRSAHYSKCTGTIRCAVA